MDDERGAQVQLSGRAAGVHQRFNQRLAERAKLPVEQAEALAAAVLCALEIRVMGEDLATVETLPLKAAELLQRCPRHLEVDPVQAAREPIVQRVSEDLGIPVPEAEGQVRAVLATLRDELTEPEADDLSRHLPNEVLPLWYHTH